MGGLFHSVRAAQAAQGSETIVRGIDSAQPTPTMYEDDLTAAPAKAASENESAPNESAASEGTSPTQWPVPNRERKQDREPPHIEWPVPNRERKQDKELPRSEQPPLPPLFAKARESYKEAPPQVKYPSYRSLPDSNPTFPGDDQVKWSQAYDQSYGSPNAGYFKPGNAKIETISIDEAQKFYDAKQAPFGRLTLTDADMSDKLHKAWLGSQRSAVAGLGFNLMRTVMSPKENKTANVAGFYKPSMWGHRRPGESPDHPWVAESFLRRLCMNPFIAG